MRLRASNQKSAAATRAASAATSASVAARPGFAGAVFSVSLMKICYQPLQHRVVARPGDDRPQAEAPRMRGDALVRDEERRRAQARLAEERREVVERLAGEHGDRVHTP